MFALTVMTLGTLAVAYAAVVLADCSIPAFELFWTDPLELCSAVDSLGVGGTPLLGVGLALFSLLAMFAIWIPVLRRHRRRKRVEPVRSLTENLDRINPSEQQVSPGDSAEDATSDELKESTDEVAVTDLLDSSDAELEEESPDPARAERVEELTDLAGGSSGDVPLLSVADTPDEYAELVGRLRALEVAVDSPDGLSRNATSNWIRLLREANDLLNAGSLSIEEFKEINTRLLDLVAKPSPLTATDSSL